MVIVDTSVAFKWFSTDEADVPLALKILDDHVKNKNSITVPDLFLYEITNAWATKKNFKLDFINENLNLLEKYSLIIAHLDFTLMEKTAAMSRKYKISVYDASYAVLAEKNGCNLITADAKFADQVKLPFVKKLG